MAFAVEIDDFSGGLNVGQRLPTQNSNSWTGRDVLVTDSGLLVPRRLAALGTGTAAGNELLTGGEQIQATHAVASSSGGPYMLAQHLNAAGTVHTVYQFQDLLDGTFSYVRSHTISAAMSDEKVIAYTFLGYEGLLWIPSPDGTIIERINLTSGGASATSVIPQCWSNTLTQWGSRGVAASSTVDGRIYYSNAGDLLTWPAGNFIDVDVVGNEMISDIVATASALYIARGTGWVVLTGAPTDMNSLSVRPLDAGDGMYFSVSGGRVVTVGGRIMYIGDRAGTFLRERLATSSRNLAFNVEGDIGEAAPFARRKPIQGGTIKRTVESGLTCAGGSQQLLTGGTGTGFTELVAWRDDKFQRHIIENTVDGFGGFSLMVSNSTPGVDDTASARGFALRASDNRVAPWALPTAETRPTYWNGGSVQGIWRSAPLAGPRPYEPFRPTKVLVEIYKFKSQSATVATGWGGSCALSARLYGDYTADVSSANLITPESTMVPWTQVAASIPDDWQREMIIFNVNDFPPTYRLVVELTMRMVAVRRVILTGEHTGPR